MQSRLMVFQTREDELQDALIDAEQENPCEDCGDDSRVAAEYISNRFWRGIKVICLNCKTITAELDAPE